MDKIILEQKDKAILHKALNYLCDGGNGSYESELDAVSDIDNILIKYTDFAD